MELNNMELNQDYSEKENSCYIEEVRVGNRPFFFFIKRIFDIVFSVISLIFMCIPMIIIAVVICIDSKGSALYKQERLGKDGVPFMMYKFRSMYIDAESNGPCWAKKQDERITKVGKFLRQSRLDELPQFFNVIKGDMSVVGPRPEREYFYNKFETYIHGFRNRLAVRPGITGWAQVNGGYELRPEEKIEYDMEYIRRMSFRTDLSCIIRTVKLVFTHEGAR